MNKEIHCITKEVFLQIPTIVQDLKLKKNIKLHSDSFKQLYKYKKMHTIHIYDIDKNKKDAKIKKIIQISNHINKTGINPIIKHQKKRVEFYDITEIYKQNNQKKIAECFGAHFSIKKKDTNKIQSWYLCNHAIIAHTLGIKNIYGYVII